MIWKTKPTVDTFDKIFEKTLVAHLQIKVEEIGDDYIKASMPVDDFTRQPMGLLHGGASVAMAESMGSVASFLILEEPDKYGIVGVEINANHLKAVKNGHVYSITKPIRIGRKIQVWNTDIYNDQDQLVCTSRLTTMTIQHH